MKYSELRRKLRKAHCICVEHGAKHDLWYSPKTGKRFTVPRHKSKEIPMGTCNSIIKDAGLSNNQNKENT